MMNAVRVAVLLAVAAVLHPPVVLGRASTSAEKGKGSEGEDAYVLEAYLVSDRDNDNRADPGDIIQYTLSGKGPFEFDVEPETANLKFLSGSVEIRRGSAVVTEGNSKSDRKVHVKSKSPVGRQTIISFNAAVKRNQPADAVVVSLQGRIVTADGRKLLTTVSPASVNEETSLPLDSFVDLSTELSATILNGPENGKASLGTVIEYKVNVRNIGNQKARDVWVSDEISPKTELIHDSVKTDGTVAIVGNILNISLGSVDADGAKEVVFHVRVTRFGSIINQIHACHVSSRKERVCQLSSDPSSHVRHAPTVTRYDNAGPVVYATKSVALGTVPTGVKPSLALPGDYLTYTVRIANLDSSPLNTVQFTDDIPSSTSLVFGSVTTTCGAVQSGNELNDPNVAVTCPLIQPGDTMVVTFCVQISQTLSNDCIDNQGEVKWEGSGSTTVVTDDPATLPLNDPTIVCVNAGPVMSALNMWTLPSGNSVASPGDVISYTIEIANTGASAAADVLFTETPDSRTSLVVGSVRTSCGKVTSGNTPWTKAISVTIPLLFTQQTCVINFDVTVKDPYPDNNPIVSVQGSVTGSNFESLVTDDPNTSVWDDATNTPINANPVVSVTKGYSLLVDYDFDGLVDPGDTVVYSISVKNSGNAPAASLLIRDIPDPRTNLALGTVVTSQGVVTSGDSEFDSSVEVDVGNLLGYSAVSVNFSVVVGNPFPMGERRIVNQAVVTYNVQGRTSVVVSGDPSTPILDDPTYTHIDCRPSLSAVKTASLAEDVNGDGQAGPGDTLHYAVTITNNGNQAASGVRMTDNLDSNTMLVLGSIRTSRANSGVLSGNSAFDPTSVVEVNVGELLGGGDSFLVTFDAVIAISIPADVTSIDNQVFLTGDNFDGVVTSALLSTVLVGGTPDVSLTLIADSATVEPGSYLKYTSIISNTGNRDAASVYFTIPSFDPNALFVLGSGTTTQGVVTKGNSISDTTFVVSVGDVPASQQVTVTFMVKVVNPFPSSVSSVTLQSVVTGSNFDKVISTDPNTGLLDAPTVTPIDGTPSLVFQKTFAISQDFNKNGQVDPGDGVTYQLTIMNTGSQDAGEVVVSDNVPSGLMLLAGSVQASQGVVAKGNGAGDGGFDKGVLVNLGTVTGNSLSKVTVSFQAIVETPWKICSAVVSNQGVLSGSNVLPLSSDDPATGLITDPTNLTLNASPVINVIRTTDSNDFNPTVPMTEHVSITNVGEQDACGVVAVVGTLGPVNVLSIATSTGVAQYNQQTNQITWTVGTVESEGGMENLTFAWTLTDPCADGDSTVVSGNNFKTVTVPGRTVGGVCQNRGRTSPEDNAEDTLTVESQKSSLSLLSRTVRAFSYVLRRFF